MILITGAAGNLGTAVIDNLLMLIPADEIVGLYRNENSAQLLRAKGIHVRFGDYTDKNSIENALQGIDKLLLISSSSKDALKEHINVVDVAKKANIKHIYYTSGALNRNVKKSQLGPLIDSYTNTESYIINSGLTYTIFQNALYMETIPYFIGYEAITTGIYFPAGAGKVTFAKRIEMGEAIANVLADEGHYNLNYILTSLPAYSFKDIAEILSEISGQVVSYYSPDPKEYEAKLKEYGVKQSDIWFSALFAAVIKNNEYNVLVTDLEKLLGRKPTSLKNYLKEIFIDN